MDGDIMRRDKWKRFLRQKQFALAAGLMVIAAVGMTGVYISENSASEKEQMESAGETDTENSIELEDYEEEEAENTEAADVSNILVPEATDETAEEEATETAAEAADNEAAAVPTGTTSADLSFSEDSELLWPLQGNVIMNYSMDQTVYYATLDQYRYNPAVIIAGNVNDKVTCAADGIITDISTNEETGCTVTMDLGNGYSAVYGQLKEVPYNTGAFVEAGDVLGYVTEPTKYYSVEGSNLYFELMQDGQPINPVTFFEE